MRHFALALIAASSLWLGTARAATHPRYGGTLRVAVSVAPASLDPMELANSADGRNLSRLLFDSLVELDARGVAQPALASSWEFEPGRQRWRFRLQTGVTFEDGSPLTPETAAAVLRAANPEWRVSPAGDAIEIELPAPVANLPAEMASAKYLIAKRGAGRLTGTGPFVVAQFDPGKRLVLTAREDYWRGRPFVNSVEIDLGKSLRDQTVALDLRQFDLVEVAPDQSKQSVTAGRRIAASEPNELVALVFSREAQSPDETRLRQALALSIDRSALNSVLMHGGGEPAGSLLPGWMTGYSFIFPAAPDADRARQLRTGLQQVATWKLGYDSADATARLTAERLSLNARDAGLALQPVTAGMVDARLVRVALNSLDARTALLGLAANLGLPQPKLEGESEQELYAAEESMLQSARAVPLLHLRSNYGLGAQVRNWGGRPDGVWSIPDLWLAPDKP